MKTNLMSLMAGASLCALVGAAQAEPVVLNGDQMDRVSAGATLIIFGQGLAFSSSDGVGNASVVGNSETFAQIDPMGVTNGTSHVTTWASSDNISLSVVNPALGIGGALSTTTATSSASLN
ncbi:MAG: hypothetical protein Kow0060_02000 [Methylohalobius crimeensis]